jgi:exoribonuclease R
MSLIISYLEKCMSHMVVDRREGGYVILIPEDDPDEEIQIPARFLHGAQEGDIYELVFLRDEIATREAREKITEMIGRLKD